MTNLGLVVLVSAAVLAAFVYIGGNKTVAESSAQDSTCRESQTRQMVGALKAIFPDIDFGAPERSACQATDAVGVDSAGALVFGEGSDLSGVQLAPLAAAAELPLGTIDELLPEFDLKKTASEYHIAYGFDREWNSGAYVLRKADGTGPVIVLVADLI